MDLFLTITAGILIITGITGCIIPVLPGPSLSYAGIILFHLTRWGRFSAKLLILLGIFTALVTIMDYVLPIWTTKKFGGSKRGILGSTIGLVAGLFFAPWGIILGPLLGAFIGEMTSNNDTSKALRSAMGAFAGFLLGTGVKFAVSGVILYYYVTAVFRAIAA